MAITNGSAHAGQNVPNVPPRPNYPPTLGSPGHATWVHGRRVADAAELRRNERARRNRQNRPSRNTKVEIGKVNLAPDVSLPPLTFSINKTTVVQGAAGGGGGGHRATPGSGFTSDEDIRAYCESLRKQARPRAVERALDAETLESALRNIPDVHGSLSGSRARARRVSRHLKRIAAAEKLIAKQSAALWSSFTREFEAELAQISSGRRRGEPRQGGRQRSNSAWKSW
jgi:hypothetical protein